MNKIMKSFLQIFLLSGMVVLSLPHTAFSAENETYYTNMNIWYENPMKIYSTNYHKGAMIPAGTKVEILEKTSKTIKFQDVETSMIFRIKLIKGYTDLNKEDFFTRYFSQENVLKGKEYASFSAMEKKNIEAGEIEEGMSKEAVLVAYGYPPSHRTPSASANSWIYWRHRYGNFTVVFRDDKVKKILG